MRAAGHARRPVPVVASTGPSPREGPPTTLRFLTPHGLEFPRFGLVRSDRCPYKMRCPYLVRTESTDTMKDNNLSRSLFPGLVFCEPTTSEMTEAGHAWITLCAEGRDPLPIGPPWDRGTVTPSCTIVFCRAINDHIDERFHWSENRCSSHHFRATTDRVSASIDVWSSEDGVVDRDEALRLTQLIVDCVLDTVGGAAGDFDDHDEDSGVGP